MILSDGAKPYADTSNLDELFRNISLDTKASLRPSIANVNLAYKKVFDIIPFLSKISFSFLSVHIAVDYAVLGAQP